MLDWTMTETLSSPCLSFASQWYKWLVMILMALAGVFWRKKAPRVSNRRALGDNCHRLPLEVPPIWEDMAMGQRVLT